MGKIINGPDYAGPWLSEPDEADWIDQDTGYECFARRGPVGAWCGYVALPEGHPWEGKHYDDLRTKDGDWIVVHGGLSFGGKLLSIPNRSVFGFDCAHAGDMSPILDAAMRRIDKQDYRSSRKADNVYRTLDYVKEQCKLLAAQLAQNDGR